eukprot:990773-Pelagomonas_calceolata.AAC.1
MFLEDWTCCRASHGDYLLVWCSEGTWEAAAQDINSPEAFPDEIIEEGEDDTTAGVGTVLSGDEHPAGPKINCVHATYLGPYNLKGIA